MLATKRLADVTPEVILRNESYADHEVWERENAPLPWQTSPEIQNSSTSGATRGLISSIAFVLKTNSVVTLTLYC